MPAQNQVASNTAVAAATENRTPRVGIVLSSFKGGEDHWGGTKLPGLSQPRPPNEEIAEAQVRAMTRRAIEFGNVRRGGLQSIAGRDDLVVLLASRHAEPVVVATVIEFLKEHQRGRRITIVSQDAKRFTGAESVDAASADSMVMPAPGIWSRRDVSYRVPKAILECDRLISIAPLRIENGRPSLTIDNYRAAAPSALANAGSQDNVAIDLFGFHVAEYAVLGGTHVFRDGKMVRHNLVLAGAKATAVDSVGAAILGQKPEELPLLQLADKRGFGDATLDLIWMRGNEIREARFK